MNRMKRIMRGSNPGSSFVSPTPKPLDQKGIRMTQSLTLGFFVTEVLIVNVSFQGILWLYHNFDITHIWISITNKCNSIKMSWGPFLYGMPRDVFTNHRYWWFPHAHTVAGHRTDTVKVFIVMIKFGRTYLDSFWLVSGCGQCPSPRQNQLPRKGCRQ